MNPADGEDHCVGQKAISAIERSTSELSVRAALNVNRTRDHSKTAFQLNNRKKSIYEQLRGHGGGPCYDTCTECSEQNWRRETGRPQSAAKQTPRLETMKTDTAKKIDEDVRL